MKKMGTRGNEQTRGINEWVEAEFTNNLLRGGNRYEMRS